MAFVAAPAAPYTTPAGRSLADDQNVIKPVSLTATSTLFKAAPEFAAGGGGTDPKPYSYAIT